ncbi:hypothetical protein J6590_016030 [Homalodisca vitripennis]|nr:hypothetical protein J6590_016030 [Homalodisca vitripennis]
MDISSTKPQNQRAREHETSVRVHVRDTVCSSWTRQTVEITVDISKWSFLTSEMFRPISYL